VEFTLGPADVPKGKLKVSVGGGQPDGRVERVEGVL
jgi:hypothetical protein